MKNGMADAIEKDFVERVTHYYPQYKDYVKAGKVFSPENIEKALLREY